MFESFTNNILIKVHPVYMADQSSPEDSRYVWAYHIVIQNKGDKPVQLRDRHWVITDASGRVEEVRGAGVVGEQPVIQAGDSFAYTSGVSLRTSNGIMRGEYTLIRDEGDAFEAVIPAFSLDSPVKGQMLN